MKQTAGISFYEEDLYLADVIQDKAIYACTGYEGANEYHLEVYVDHSGNYRIYQCQVKHSLDIQLREYMI